MAKAVIINVVICNGGNAYTVTYASGVLKTASIEKMPATVKKWLDDHKETEAVEIVLEPLPERGAVITEAPDERTLTEAELDAFERAFVSDMAHAQSHVETAGATETAVVKESHTEAEIRQSEPHARDVEDAASSLIPRAAGAVMAGSLLLAVEVVYWVAVAPLAAAAQVARWIASVFLILASALDQAKTHAPQIRDTMLDAVARGMDAALDTVAWIAYQAVEIGTEVAWLVAGAICTACIEVKKAWDFRHEVIQAGKEVAA